jgi:hypothetical protein
VSRGLVDVARQPTGAAELVGDDGNGGGGDSLSPPYEPESMQQQTDLAPVPPH